MYRYFLVNGNSVPNYEPIVRGGEMDEAVAPLERQSASKLLIIAKLSENSAIRERAAKLYYGLAGAWPPTE